jgi:ubiquinone/menaquinone biosynthesis C-methylase UbiE
MDELARIKEIYSKRKQLGKGRLYTHLNSSALFITQQREKELLSALSQFGIDDLSTYKIIDIGCGTGGVLLDFIRYGACPSNLCGVDLLSDRIERACEISPNVDFKCASGECLPYVDNSFDILLLFTVFTSIFDFNKKKCIALESLRILKPGGIIIYYDFMYNNPRNPDVKGVPKKEIFELFPNCRIYLKRITLAPPLVRIIAPYSYLVCYFLEKFRIFNTHYLGIIRKTPD